ncbi:MULTISPECIES: TIGR03767 family metallophosphoesterase [unclassified Streptomyces]|uniref:TIGR03767 family metallophosphoesterase n=1 Tax=unclassified Streptomyces TaxID=2593676 RepID=UPI002E81EA5C|nr:TIGR03767 family metallophosphoesterase [Streptomyces sp. NBC_00589]WTI40909.1 TIGR03767 family metallophosphoesterase [Streptomyces sp. NBC_00775]WUB25407.1 TIGR03767 family metallophosphoesterase [Streptomyces sp. NBC_00589]
MAGTEPASAINRRRFLLASAAAVAAGAPGTAGALLPRQRAHPSVGDASRMPARTTRHPAPYGTTTLETTARLGGAPHTGTYRRLVPGPGWPLVVRGELAPPRAGREDRRTALACFVQFTDLHLADVQNPLRTEFLRSHAAAAWRAQEALTVAGAVALVEQVNAFGGGPHTHLPPAFVMTTGDNVDNNSAIELEWFLTLMSGGRITPNTGDPTAYEGVQNSGLPLYWHPGDAALRDLDKRRGLPVIPGFLDAATRPVTSPGLRIPWYSTVGNHDDLPGGCLSPALGDFAVGSRKLLSVPAADAAAYARALGSGDDPKSEVLKAILSRHAASARTVTADERRRLCTPHDYLAAHLDPAHAGAGPVGHGYTEDHLDGERMYYSFRIAENVIGISVDTTYRSGHYEGSLGTGQLRWLERTLAAHSSRSYDADGRLVRNTSADDARILVFSHHHSPSMTRRPDAARTDEPRHDGAEVIALLGRFPNVVAWINGHSHVNRITPHAHATPARSFWEVNTASHVDYPHHARLFELADNGDGTVSLFTTLIESAAPHRTAPGFDDLSAVGLASLYRELAYNAPGLATGARAGVHEGWAGGAGDRNTELVGITA